MHAPICVTCQLEMQVHTTGVVAEEMVFTTSYRLIYAEEFRCPGCGILVVANFAERPLAEHFRPDYEDIRRGVAARCRRAWLTRKDKMYADQAAGAK